MEKKLKKISNLNTKLINFLKIYIEKTIGDKTKRINELEAKTSELSKEIEEKEKYLDDKGIKKGETYIYDVWFSEKEEELEEAKEELKELLLSRESQLKSVDYSTLYGKFCKELAKEMGSSLEVIKELLDKLGFEYLFVEMNYLDDFSKIVEYINKEYEQSEIEYNAYVNCYNLTNNFDMDIDKFLQISDVNEKRYDDEMIDDIYDFIGSSIDLYDTNDAEDMYGKSEDDRISYYLFRSYIGTEELVKKRSKLFGITLSVLNEDFHGYHYVTLKFIGTILTEIYKSNIYIENPDTYENIFRNFYNLLKDYGDELNDDDYDDLADDPEQILDVPEVKEQIEKIIFNSSYFKDNNEETIDKNNSITPDAGEGVMGSM